MAGKLPLHPAHIAEACQRASWPIDWFGKPNSVSLPRGRRYGLAHFLLSQKTLDEIDWTEPVAITCTHESGTTTWAGYYFVSSESVTQSPDDSAHFVTLADRRWLLERTIANTRYNLRMSTADYTASTTNGGTPWTWEEIIEELWDLLPSVAGTVPAMPITPTSTPENFLFDGMSVWRAINQVLTAIGCGIVLARDGTFTIIELKADQDLTDIKKDNRNRLAWQYSPRGAPYFESADITFPAGLDDDSPPFESTPAIETVALGQDPELVDTAFPIVDTFFSYDDNSAERGDRAAEIANAVIGLTRPSAEPWGEVYNGVVEFEPGPEITEVAWSSDGYRGMETTVRYFAEEIDWPTIQLGGAGGGTIKIVKATTNITPRVADAVGFGTVEDYKIVTGNLTSATNTFTIYNIDPVTIPSGMYFRAAQELLSGEWICLHPGIINLRLNGSNLEYTLNGSDWTIWTTAVAC